MESSVSIWGFDKIGETELPVSHLIRHRLDLGQLESLFQDVKPTEMASQKRCLLVVKHPSIEDLTSLPQLRRVLQIQMGVPASLFQAHRWTQTISRFTEAINFPRLPTAINPRSRFSLEYFELWEVLDNEMFSYHLQMASTIECAATGRQIQCHKWIKRPGWLLIAPRKCSFWSKKHHSGWNAVVLCDVPPERVKVNGETIQLTLKPFQGGYHGFIPDDLKDWREESPPHTSFFDDLTYYLKDHTDLLPNIENSDSVSMFIKKIVASHYCQLLGFVGHQTPSMRATGWAVQRRTQEEIDESNQVETAWSHYKCPEYHEALSTVLDALGISQGRDPFDMIEQESDTEPKPQPQCLSPPDQKGKTQDLWHSSVPDFLYLHREFRERIAEYARMTSSLAALNGMIGGRIAILEARTAKSLTLVAMLFAPPACVASIFSIPASIFGDSGPQFWIYWVVALPLTGLVFFLTYVVHERDVVKRTWRAQRPKRPSHPVVPKTSV